jgi:arginine decarboxylase
MAKPSSRILVINDEHLVLREFVKGLNAAARSLDNPLGISFIGATTVKEGLALIESEGELQAVLVDDTLYKIGDNSKKKLQMSALELVQRIARLRPELDMYIVIAQEKEDDVVDALFAESVDGYFYREERDYRGIYRILNAQIQERARTPFYDALKNYVWMAKDQWHTPGHSSGESLRGSPWVNDFYEFMGEHVFDADLSVSVPMLDSLMEPKGVIGEAQAMAAKAFGEQGDLPDAAGAGREAAARPQLPQERAPRRGALRRASHLSRLGAEPQVRPVRAGPQEAVIELH